MRPLRATACHWLTNAAVELAWRADLEQGQAEDRLWWKIREVPMLRYVFPGLKSDESTSYEKKTKEAHRSIHTDIGRGRWTRCEIR